MHFDIVDIRLMVNIAETSSLARGAERSHLSSPAASNRVRNLEEHLGVRLFYRSSQGVTLTPSGQAFMHHARQVLQQLQHLYGDMQEYAQGIKGHVRIWANTTASTEFLPALLGQFLRSHPSVNIDLHERLSGDIVRAVSDGMTDVGIVAGGVQAEGLQVLPFREDRLVLVTPRGHPLAASPCTAFTETLAYDQISMPESSAIRGFLDHAAGLLGKPLKLRIQVGNFEAVCRMIEAGVGIGVVPESAARRHARTMEICIVQLEDEWALRKLQICVRDLNVLPSFARELVDALVASAKA